jgi:hypothetical protein
MATFSDTYSHKIMHMHTHVIMNDSTQAQYLAKVFNSPKIKHLNKVLTWSTKSEVLQPDYVFYTKSVKVFLDRSATF